MNEKKKNNKTDMERVFKTLSDMGTFDRLVESGDVKIFHSKEEENDYLKSHNIKKESVEVVNGEEGRKIVEKVGRNQKCICGSGLKYKKCCLNNNQYGVG
jgi:preprotein translocase subunit SecA|tara:strand:+ start:1259 stop:1558 length:300 start_codon:yes stop_codon:yes gene_type:complete